MSVAYIATEVGGQPTLHGAFDPESVYPVSDDAPYVLVAAPKRPRITLEQDSLKSQVVDPRPPLTIPDTNLVWFRLPLFIKSQLSEGRPLGFGELRLRSPRVVVRYYLWPRRLFRFEQWADMLAQCRAELGVAPWTASGDRHVGVEVSSHAGGLDASACLEQLEHELRAAHQILRRPFSEAWSDDVTAGALPPLPENELVLRWMSRRRPLARQLVLHLEQAVEHLREELDLRSGNRPAQNGYEQQLVKRETELRRALRARGSLKHLSESLVSSPRAGLILTPAMFRDHRLRRLLSALRPSLEEHLRNNMERRSSLPVLRTPQLFELWGAVWLIRVLRGADWEVSPPQGRREGSDRFLGELSHARWRLTRGAYKLTLDWNPTPRVVTPIAVGERCQPGLAWAASHLRAGGEVGNCIFATRPATPDYVLRVTGPAGFAFGIGDASLADPKHQKGQKVETITRYVREVAWLPPGGSDVVTCAPLGLFLLLPGPREGWEKLLTTAAALDCRVFAPVPARVGEVDARGVLDWIEHLVDAADSGRP